MRIGRLVSGLAVVGLAATLGSCSLIGGSNQTTPRDPNSSITASQVIDPFSVQLGDCLMQPADETFSDLTVVGCNQAHDAEITNIFDMPDGSFNQDDVTAAGEQCEAAAETYVGPHYADLGLDWNYFSPTSDSWADGDREIDCIIYTLSGNPDLTSSTKGQGN